MNRDLFTVRNESNIVLLEQYLGDRQYTSYKRVQDRHGKPMVSLRNNGRKAGLVYFSSETLYLQGLQLIESLIS